MVKEQTAVLTERDRQYYISIIRLTSLALIISCHILQYLQMELAWWLNVGVQIFLCISGFLYGQRETPKPIDFYKHRFIKILIPYYIVFCTAGLLYFLFAPNVFSWLYFGAGLIYRASFKGAGHLWFVKVILVCYILTPLLGVYRDRYVKNLKSFVLYAIASIAIVSIVFGIYAVALNPAWISCYVIGYCLGVNEKRGYFNWNLLLTIFAFLAVIGNGIQIYISYFKGVVFSGKLGIIYLYFKDYNHAALGIFLFLLMKFLFEKIQIGQATKQLLDFADEYSYETYLVHQFLILGPFSLMSLTNAIMINIIIILFGIMLLSILLKIVERVFLRSSNQ